MTEAIECNTTPPGGSGRRNLLAATAAMIAAPTALAASTAHNPDAELIADCRRFAEAELTTWYLEVVSDHDIEWPEFGEDRFDKIVAKPATTFEGMAAKALAFSAYSSDLNDLAQDTNRDMDLLRSLMQDMVGRERTAMLAKLADQYGPLPSHYDAQGRFIGYSEEEAATRKAEREREQAEGMARQGFTRSLPPLTETAEMECVGLTKAGDMFLWQHRTIKPCSAISKSGARSLYVIDWRGHALAAWISANDFHADIKFVGDMASASLPTWQVERLVMGTEAGDAELTQMMRDLLRTIRERDEALASLPSHSRGRITA